MALANLPIMFIYLMIYFTSEDQSQNAMDSMTMVVFFDVNGSDIILKTGYKSYLHVVLITFVIHMLLQHLMIILFNIECDYY